MEKSNAEANIMRDVCFSVQTTKDNLLSLEEIFQRESFFLFGWYFENQLPTTLPFLL